MSAEAATDRPGKPVKPGEAQTGCSRQTVSQSEPCTAVFCLSSFLQPPAQTVSCRPGSVATKTESQPDRQGLRRFAAESDFSLHGRHRPCRVSAEKRSLGLHSLPVCRDRERATCPYASQTEKGRETELFSCSWTLRRSRSARQPFQAPLQSVLQAPCVRLDRQLVKLACCQVSG